MMELLRFTFGGFWTFCGVCFLIGVILDGTAAIIRAFRGKP